VNELTESIVTSMANVSKKLRLHYDVGFLGREERVVRLPYGVERDLSLRLCDFDCERLNRQAKQTVPEYPV
jgi:hypothetical protein